MAANINALAKQAMMGLFRSNFLEGDGSLIATAPLADTRAAAVEYLKDQNRYDVVEGEESPDFGPDGHRNFNMNFGNVTFTLRPSDLGMFVIPRATLNLFSANNGVDLVGVGGSLLVRRAVSEHAQRVISAASALAVGPTTIDLSGINNNFIPTIRTAQEEIKLACGRRPDTLTIDERALGRLANSVQVSPGGAITAGTGAVVKTGTSSFSAVRAWTAENFDMNLVVVDSRIQTASGNLEYQLEGEMLLTYRGNGRPSEQTTFKTVHHPGSAPAGIAPDLAALMAIFSIDVRESAPPERVGLAVSGEASYTIHPMWPESGLRIPVTLDPS